MLNEGNLSRQLCERCDEGSKGKDVQVHVGVEEEISIFQIPYSLIAATQCTKNDNKSEIIIKKKKSNIIF